MLRQSRQRLAQLVGTQADELVYLSNATTAVNVVARSLDLRPGDEVLSTSLEYGACDLTWQRVCHAAGAIYRQVRVGLPLNPHSVVSDIQHAMGPRTRVVFMSHIASTTALILPVAEVVASARQRGILSFIDGAHAPGQIEVNLDALGADFYTGNAHKWMCAPKGAAFLHARAEHHERLHAGVTSWGYAREMGASGAGHEGYTGLSVLERRLQWQGTRDLSAWLSVPAAIDFIEDAQWQAAAQQARAQALELMQQICERVNQPPLGPHASWARMVCLPLPHPVHQAATVQEQLRNQDRIEAPVTVHGDRAFVRISVQPYNDAADLQAVLDASIWR